MVTESQRKQLRSIPSVHELLQHSFLTTYTQADDINQQLLTELCQECTQKIREDIMNQNVDDHTDLVQLIVQRIQEQAEALLYSPLKPLLNGTGVILHTNLGRAKLSKTAQEELIKVSTYYSNLEYELDSGNRGSRHSIVEDIICRLTGAEAALVCNNNASAVFLVLNEFAQDKEVIVSRGELVEIGGSFRVSEIMRKSGALLVEVGTTNKTHTYDYERALTDNTAMILKVHTSNFVVRGFTASVSGTELVHIAHEHSIPIFEDLGSGVLLDLRPFGIGEEPTVQEVIQEGVDIVSFSADKLLGGPQAGIIAGKKEYIQRLKKNQLMRSLRVDKFTLAALHATLKSYLDPSRAVREVPTLRMILEDAEVVRKKAQHFLTTLQNEKLETFLVPLESEVGGGTLPDVTIPSWGVAIKPIACNSVAAFARQLRTSDFPIIGRIQQDNFILDFRTIDQEEIPILLSVMQKL